MSVLHHQITAPNETVKREFNTIIRVIIGPTTRPLWCLLVL